MPDHPPGTTAVDLRPNWPRLANVHEAGDVARVGHKTVRKWVREGRITAYRASHNILRVDLDEIIEMLRAGGAK